MAKDHLTKLSELVKSFELEKPPILETIIVPVTSTRKVTMTSGQMTTVVAGDFLAYQVRRPPLKAAIEAAGMFADDVWGSLDDRPVFDNEGMVWTTICRTCRQIRMLDHVEFPAGVCHACSQPKVDPVKEELSAPMKAAIEATLKPLLKLPTYSIDPPSGKSFYSYGAMKAWSSVSWETAHKKHAAKLKRKKPKPKEKPFVPFDRRQRKIDLPDD